MHAWVGANEDQQVGQLINRIVEGLEELCPSCLDLIIDWHFTCCVVIPFTRPCQWGGTSNTTAWKDGCLQFEFPGWIERGESWRGYTIFFSDHFLSSVLIVTHTSCREHWATCKTRTTALLQQLEQHSDLHIHNYYVTGFERRDHGLCAKN